MTLNDSIAQVRKKLDMISQYDNMVSNNDFEPDTVDDMKGNAKDICAEIKSVVDDIKTEIDNWS